MKDNYRSEIDGLRALAVLPVVFFHAGFNIFSGGFIGVDIFFVISGYLITTIILNELNENTFSFKSFFLRRARRILRILYTKISFCSKNLFITIIKKKFVIHIFIKNSNISGINF